MKFEHLKNLGTIAICCGLISVCAAQNAPAPADPPAQPAAPAAQAAVPAAPAAAPVCVRPVDSIPAGIRPAEIPTGGYSVSRRSAGPH